MNVSRYLNDNMEELRFAVEFVTPCFLGGANGNAEVRTAPFKNLIRRWWRIVNGKLSPEELWKKEAELFGSTEKNPDTKKIIGKSKVSLRIICEESNYTFKENNKLMFSKKKIKHPEVDNEIGFETYLGMGPVFWNKEKHDTEYKFKPINAYTPEIREIDSRTKQERITAASGYLTMSLLIPKNNHDDFIKVLTLINYFGTIGSRSRNGWGSLNINPLNGFELLKPKNIKDDSILWSDLISDDCKKKYPSAIAKDESGRLLCWRTPQRNTWDEAMYDAAKIYCKLRTHFKFTGGNDVLSDRHLLGYPITHHDYIGWPVKNTRLPSQLYIKINLNQGKYSVFITHIPNLIPLEGFSVDRQMKIWNSVHNFLDGCTIDIDGQNKNLSRFGGSK